MIRIILIILILLVLLIIVWKFYPRLKNLFLKIIKSPIGILLLKKIIRFIIRRFIG